MIKTKRTSSKLGVSLLTLMFAVGFGLGGWFGGILPMVQQLQGWWHAGNLVAVQAQVNKLELRERLTDDGSQFSVLAEFEYQYNDKTYLSRRIHLGDDSSDSGGGYNQRIHASLLQARDNHQNITLWVDRQEPAFAVFDKKLRLTRLIFRIPFATVFPAVSLMAWWALWAIWFKSDQEETNLYQQTARELKEQDTSYTSSSKLELRAEPSGAAALAVFAVFWNLISVPLAVAVYLQKNAGGMSIAFVTVFPALGAIMIWIAIRRRFLRRRIGEPVLILAQPPYTGIENMPLRLRFDPVLGTRMRTTATHYPVKLEVLCEHEDRRSEDTTTKTLWSQTLRTQQIFHDAKSMDFNISLPANLPASDAQESQGVKIIWKLKIKALNVELFFKLTVRQGPGKPVSTSDVPDREYLRG